LTFARITLRRFQLEVQVPDPDGWHPVRGKSRFVELTHQGSSSRLLLRAWFEREVMDRKRCEEAARLYRDLPNGGQLLSRATASVPEGFDTEVVAAMIPGAPVRGYLTAFGARARHCFALSFTSDGPSSQIIEERIAVIDRRTVGTIRVLSGIDSDVREQRDVDEGVEAPGGSK
jgi:hypothetical protein